MSSEHFGFMGLRLRPLRLLRLVVTCVLLLDGARAENPTVAVLAVHSPPELAHNYPGHFATFSGWPLPKGDLEVHAPPEDLGCGPYPDGFADSQGLAVGPAPARVAVVLRGNCTFVQKALMAQAAGAKGIIIVSDSQTVQVMGAGNATAQDQMGVGIFVVGIDRTSGEKLRNASLAAANGGAAPVHLSISPYASSLLDASEGVLILVATVLVALGAFFSTADLDVHPPGSFSTSLAPPQEEVLEVDHWMAAGFCLVGSCFLVILFFFMRYMIYVIIFFFCMGGASCITQFGAIVLTHLIPALRNRGFDVPVIGLVAYAEAIALVPAVIIVVSWVTLRNTRLGWPFQDIIGAGFLCFLQRTLRLPNMKIATLLLSAMFFFDIFWVFISPLFFHESVMVRVATGGGTGESVPMLLRVPAVGDAFGNDRLLGFGDIALPGLLVSYLRRHDLMSRRPLRQGYFAPALVGYFFGLIATMTALILMRMGQPALLYLVPGTLGTTLVYSSCRGECHLLWEGIPASDSLGLKDNMESDSSTSASDDAL